MSASALASWVRSAEISLRRYGLAGAKGHGAAYVGTDLEFLGLTAPVLRSLSAEWNASLPASWEESAHALWQKPVFELRIVAILLAARRAKEFRKTHWTLFTSWLKESAGWAMVDTLCGEVLSPMVVRFPELASKTDAWTKSRNPWLRRASLVVFCSPLRKGLFTEISFEHAAILASERDPMITKAESWILRSAIKHFRSQVEDFLNQHESELASLVLREVRTKLTTGRKTPGKS